MIKQIGPHRVKHGSITEGIADLMDGAKADLIYMDPPWGEGNVRYWQTMNVKQNADAHREDISYQQYMDALLTIVSDYANGPVLIEYGQKWRDQFIDSVTSRTGLAHSCTVELLYQSGSKVLPCDLHLFGAATPTGFQHGIHHTMGYNTLRTAFQFFAEPGKVVLDPCCGMGYTAQAALDTGMVFYGNELNGHRLLKTIRRLERAT